MKRAEVKNFDSLKPEFKEMASYFKAYPDRFLDYISDERTIFKLYFYQRILLRALFRFRYVYLTLTRGSAKSFTEILAMLLKCIMNPNGKYFIVAPRKEQASKIVAENFENIITFFPILEGEIDRKKCKFDKDFTRIVTKNGAKMEVVTASDASRGGRNHGGAIEEIVDPILKKDVFQDVIIPRMANDRMAMNGQIDPDENHKFQWYVTTSGSKQSFAYEKLQEVMWRMANGESAISLGSSFELPVMHSQLDEDFINEIRESPNTNPLGFSREYGSNWTGSSEDSLVDLEDFSKTRVIKKAEWKAEDKDAEYILSYDVARVEGKRNASSALVVIKIKDRGDGTYQKFLVNIFTFEGVHFRDQALFLKQKVNDYEAKMLVVDANGIGRGLVDQLVLEIDENPPYAVVNDASYDQYRTENSAPVLFSMTSSRSDTSYSDIHNHFVNVISNNKVKMLVSESEARGTEKIKRIRDEEKLSKEVTPFVATDFLQEEVMNLEQVQKGNRTSVKQISKSIQKDKFSALQYGLFYIHTLEQKNITKKDDNSDPSKFLMGRRASIGV